MGYGVTEPTNWDCGTQASPTTQNIQSNLVDTSIVTFADKAYWSSTELIYLSALSRSFTAYSPGIIEKYESNNVRCVRLLS